MKTSRFEKTLRQKLESIQPEFQDQDWTKLQSYQQLHAPQTFWQTYGHWIGYATATIATAAMVVLYVNQSNQNDRLIKEMESLKQQVAIEKSTQPSSVSIPTKTDTVYIIQRQEIIRERPMWAELPGTLKTGELVDDNSLVSSPEATPINYPASKPDAKPAADQELASEVAPEITDESTPTRIAQTKKTTPDQTTGKPVGDQKVISPADNSSKDPGVTTQKSEVASNQPTGDDASPPTNNTSLPVQSAAPSNEPIRLTAVAPLSAQKPVFDNQKYQRRLMKRMPQVATTSLEPEKPKQVQSVAKAEKVKKSERLLPDFNLNIPYRVGIGQQWEGRTNAFSVWNEVLLSDHWSIQAGLSWRKLEDQKFFSEATFREEKREDFRKDNAPRLPSNFKIFNIVTATTLTQIPLNLVYRDAISRDFSYFVGAGTNLNIRAKQLTTFDFERPTRDFGQDGKQRNATVPLITNFLVSAGIEKRWNPIILQVDSYLTTRTKAMPFSPDRTSVGLRVKLLYEFGRDRKN